MGADTAKHAMMPVGVIIWSLRWGMLARRAAFTLNILSLKDKYVLRRMGRDLKYHLLELTRSVWCGHLLPAIRLVYVVELIYGAGYWLVTQRKTQL